MARLSPVKPRIWPQSGTRTTSCRETSRDEREETTPNDRTTKHKSRNGAVESEVIGKTWLKSNNAWNGDKISPPKVRLQKAGTGSGGIFDIFSDGDPSSESEREEPRPASAARDSKPRHLKKAHVNSLLLPLPLHARSRPIRKASTNNYDKENDLSEEEPDNYAATTPRNPPNALARQSTARRAARHTPGRNRNGQQILSRQQPETPNESKNEDSDENSLDDFIVSDNEEPSCHETSEAETEEERVLKTSPQTKPKRRLMRGRRPNPEAELRKALENSPYKEDFHLEPSLPKAIRLSASKPDLEPKRLFQNDLNNHERKDRLRADDNDASSQLENDLYKYGVPSKLHCAAFDLDSPVPKPDHTHSKLETPPSSRSKNRLRSPTKEKIRIPPTPYRESSDAFWSQEVTNDWIDRHSPRKETASARALDQLLQEFDEVDSRKESTMIASADKKGSKTPSKTALRKAEAEQKRALLARKKSFDNKKAAFAEEFFKTLDDTVTGGQIQKLAEETGGVKIIWSKTLQTTAGRANWKRERSQHEPLTDRTNPGSNATSRHHASVELAERIIDNEDRLLNTLAHEYCHLANFMISNVHNNPHGTSFKQWGLKCTEALKNHPVYGGRVEVTTKHSYKIDYKYVWCCVDCGQNYGRHSRSIDPSKARCGVCQGLLQQIKPKPRNVSPKKKQIPSTPAAPKNEVDEVAKVLEVVTISD